MTENNLNSEKVKKKILILTSDAGMGHRSAANAVAAALKETHGDECVVHIINPLNDKHAPAVLRDSQSDYDKLVRESPELYRLGYDITDGIVSGAIFESVLVVLLFNIMENIIRTYQPDAILCTHPFFQTPLVAVFTLYRKHIPLMTTITDLQTVHRIWFYPDIDECLVPTEAVYNLAVKKHGMPTEMVHITGIPVNPKLAVENKDVDTLRRNLGWQTNIPTFLAVGSRRTEHLLDTINIINHFGTEIQLIVATGDDQALFSHLEEVDWHIPVQLYHMVDNMDEFMHASDAIICKAGGLITTEALACGLPMLLVNVIPGQETGNAQFVLDGGAGEVIKRPLDVLEILKHWFIDDRKLFIETAKNAKRLGKPRAAYEVGDRLWLAAQQNVLETPRKAKLKIERPNLIELLSRHDIPW